MLILNVIRYFIGGPIELKTIMEPMHSVMPRYPGVFDNDFTSTDFTISLFYNFSMWFWAAVVFHFIHPALKGPMVVRSLQSFVLMALFFCSVAAVYMNHYVDGVKPFYVWSMIDAFIVFPLVGLANGFLYPLFFRRAKDAENPSGE